MLEKSVLFSLYVISKFYALYRNMFNIYTIKVALISIQHLLALWCHLLVFCRTT